MTPHIVKIGPKGGKIVNFHNGKPIYLDDAAGHGFGLALGEHSPGAAAAKLGLDVRQHASRPGMVQVAWSADQADAAKTWFHSLAATGGFPPGAEAHPGKDGAAAMILPAAWVSSAHAGAQPITAPAPTPKPKAKPKGLDLPEGVKLIDKKTLKNPITAWQRSPGHPVATPAGEGTLIGRAITEYGHPTGELVVMMPDGKAAAFPEEKVASMQAEANAPWQHDGVVAVQSEQATQTLNATFAQQVAGLKGTTFQQVFDAIRDQGHFVTVQGGLVRDALLGVAAKDVDMGFSCSAQELVALAAKKGWAVPYSNPKSGLVQLGNPEAELYLEGKQFNGTNNAKHPDPKKPIARDSDVARDRSCRDFTCNALAYDPHNKVILDPTGTGVADAVGKKLRIAVPPKERAAWLKADPTRALRYLKFRARGYEPADEETHTYLTGKLAELAGTAALSHGMITSWVGHQIVGKGNVKSSGPGKKKWEAFKASTVQIMGQSWWDAHVGG